MICAETVKPEEILWNPRENPSQTKSPAQLNARFESLCELCGFPFANFAVKSSCSCTQIRAEKGPEIKMRPGPATPAASSVDLPTRLIRHSRGGMMLLARQRSRGSAAFAKAGCTRDLAITAQPLRGPAAHSHS